MKQEIFQNGITKLLMEEPPLLGLSGLELLGLKAFVFSLLVSGKSAEEIYEKLSDYCEENSYLEFFQEKLNLFYTHSL